MILITITIDNKTVTVSSENDVFTSEVVELCYDAVLATGHIAHNVAEAFYDVGHTYMEVYDMIEEED